MRTDVSKYLIHSVRRPNKMDFSHDNEEVQLYYPLKESEEIYDEYEVLINIIEEGGLRAGYSFRNGNSTIYGGDPVVCFTEMPLINLIQYVKDRNDKYRFTEYGVAVLKKDVYEMKGRPIISGLAENNKFKFKDFNKRIIHPSILPYTEQYRYVKLDLTNGTDWTHEREWRIKCEYDKKDFSIRDDRVLNVHNTWGIGIFTEIFFSETIIILKTEEEAREVQQIVQKQLDSGYSKGGNEFSSKVKYLIIDKAVNYLDNNSLTRIEDLPKDTFYTHSYEEISDEEKKEIKLVINECIKLGAKFADEFMSNTKIEKNKDGSFKDVCGFCHVASYKTTNKYMRFLLNEGIATSIGDCILLYGLKNETPFNQCMSYNKYVAHKQSDFLNEHIDEIFTTYSIMD